MAKSSIPNLSNGLASDGRTSESFRPGLDCWSRAKTSSSTLVGSTLSGSAIDSPPPKAKREAQERIKSGANPETGELLNL
jgi:hypothetical protein